MLRPLSVSSALLFLTILLGCSGGSDLDTADPNAPADPSSPNGGTSSPGRQNESNASTSELDTSAATSVTAASGYCGGVPGTCNGQESFEIVFATSTLEKRTCVPGRKPTTTASTKRVLDASEMQRVRDSLAEVRVSSAPFANNQDGNMFALTVTSASGTKDYSPEPSCGHSRFEKIVGFEQLWKTVRGL